MNKSTKYVAVQSLLAEYTILNLEAASLTWVFYPASRNYVRGYTSRSNFRPQNLQTIQTFRRTNRLKFKLIKSWLSR
jgi:hypothetical protein